ncbi:MAG: SDR family oxidoreductase [Planctomycetota bacterium]
MNTDFLGKTAVVTGASSGIGRAIALELAGRGADLVLHARQNAEGLTEVATRVKGLGRRCRTELADLSHAEGRQTLVAAAWSGPPVDIWVHNAGADVLTGDAASADFDAKLEQLWRVDVAGTIGVCRAVGRAMADRGAGVILTVGWDQAETGMEGDPGQMFGPTKAAVMAFTKSLAKTLAPAVRVNCVAPGWIKTRWGDDAPEYWRRRAVGEALLSRWGTPEDVAAAAAFLASPQAAFITGQVVNVNGGFAGRAAGEADRPTE